MPSPGLDEIVTTTLRNRSGRLADNATKTIALLDRLRRRGKVKSAAGGRTIVQELEYQLNNQGGWYAGYDVLNVAPADVFTAAEYDWKQAYIPVTISGLDQLKNSGESQIVDLLSARIRNAEKSLSDLVAQAAYSDGTGFGGKQLQGLGLLVPTSPTTGTVGGIDRATWSFWRSKIKTGVNFTTPANIATNNPSAFLTAMNDLAIQCTRGSDRPDLWVADGNGYQRYLESLQPIQRITSPEMAGAGFTSLKYYAVGGDSDVVLDNGYCPTSTMFALNTSYIYLRPHSDRNFVPIGGERLPVNQDALVRFLGFAGNMCLSNASLQGRMTT
jgi:hypothetical protein